MRVLSQFTTVHEEETGTEIPGRVVVDEDGTLRFQSRDEQPPPDDEDEDEQAAAEGSRPPDEEVGTPKA